MQCKKKSIISPCKLISWLLSEASTVSRTTLSLSYWFSFPIRQPSHFFVPIALYLLPEASLGVSCDTHRLPWPSPLVLMLEGHGDSSGWVIAQLSFVCLEAVSHFLIAAKSEAGVAGSEAF